MVIDIESSVKSGTEHSSLDTHASVSYSGWGVSAKASAGFAKAVNDSSKLSKT